MRAFIPHALRVANRLSTVHASLLRMPRRRVKAGDVALFALAVIIVYIIGRIASGR